MYQAGFCELDITPPIGTIIPGYFHARYSQGVLDPLYARACVIRQGDGYAAFVTADCCGLYRCVTDEVRRRVAEQTPIPPERVMVMATHTHSGGPTLNWGEEVRIDPVYLESFVKKLADALIAVSYTHLHIEGAFYLGIGLLFLLYGYYRGLGRSMMSIVLTVISLGSRVLLAYLLSACLLYTSPRPDGADAPSG